jgi:uncharacterized protein YutE (UPF0331/DUF86 family)
MTDPELISKKLAEIETYLRELRTLSDIAKLRIDIKEQRFIALTLQLAIQAALDISSHIVSDERLGEPRTNRELFMLLEQNNWIPESLAQNLRDMVGFRNVLVHGYDRLNLDVVEDVINNRLSDIEAFVGAVRTRLQSS